MQPVRNPFEHKPFRYTLMMQNILFLSMGASILGIVGLISFTNPYQNSLYVWIFLLLIWVLITGAFSYVQFWWFFAIKSEIIQVHKVNLIIYKSIVLSALSVYTFTLMQINRFNYLNVAVIILTLVGYFIFIKEE